MIEWLDSVLRDATQRFSEKFQRLTGLTKFTLEKWASIASTIFFCGFSVCAFRYIGIGLALLTIILSAINIRRIEKEEIEFMTNDKLDFRLSNEFSVRKPLLIVDLFAIPWFSLVIFFGNQEFQIIVQSQCILGAILSNMAWRYFSICIPKPPAKSKVREWSEKALGWLSERLQPSPVPEAG